MKKTIRPMPAETAVTIAATVAGRSDVVPLLWGPTSSRKTTTVIRLAERLNMDHVVIVPAGEEPAEFLGFPIRTNGSVRYAAPPWWPEREAVILIDEIDKGERWQLAPLLRLLREKSVRSRRLPDGTLIILAGNSENGAFLELLDTPDGLFSPLRERLLFIPVADDAESLRRIGLRPIRPFDAEDVEIVVRETENAATAAFVRSVEGVFPDELSRAPEEIHADCHRWLSADGGRPTVPLRWVLDCYFASPLVEAYFQSRLQELHELIKELSLADALAKIKRADSRNAVDDAEIVRCLGWLWTHKMREGVDEATCRQFIAYLDDVLAREDGLADAFREVIRDHFNREPELMGRFRLHPKVAERLEL